MTSDPSSQELSPIKRALLEIRDLRARLAEVEQAQSEPVAITGIALRFPGDANDLETFWRLLRDGVDAIREIPPERWDLEVYYHADVSVPGKMTTRYGGFLQDVDRFDAAFFGISPREAASMDPQQRLLLETTWEALENAGQSPDQLPGTQTGVFVGISNSDYFRKVVSDPNKIDTYSITGGMFSVAAGRIAYLLGLQGPALSIDTACSSSLVAVHLACQSLRQKECNLALAGGVNLILSPEANINFSKAGMMALDGRCKTFDDAADGYVRSEGCAMLVLKRLSDALADSDPILAVVRGSAVNQDGRSNGLTAPNGPAQEAVMQSALKAAGVEARQVAYVEAHGTGTSLGDPIEVRALAGVYGQGRDLSQPLLIGSVKTNVGHLEATAGVAGLIKVVCALQRGEIPPSLHFQTPNRHIAWADYPIQVAVERTPWPALDGRRLAGVSSFGFSGTNAHVILEAAPPVATRAEAAQEPLTKQPRLVTLSAKSEAALRELAGRYETTLSGREWSPTEFTALARQSGAGRAHLPHRLAVMANSAEQLRERLTTFRAGQQSPAWWQGRQAGSEPPPVVFLFTGHGSHYLDMGRGLYESEPVFRQAMQRCDELLRGRLPRPLLEVIYPAHKDEQADAWMQDMTYGQPAMFALEYALACLWRSWGIEPAAVAGHSLGEYAAATVAGVFSLEDGLALIAERGRLMQLLPDDGMMVTIFAPEERVSELIAPYAERVSIAAANSPEAMVVSGPRAAVQAVVDAAAAQNLRTRALNISRAAHSPMVEPMLADMAHACAAARFSPPEIEFVSAVSGKPVGAELARPEYWVRHLRQTVRFGDAFQSLYDAGYRAFLEIGPHPTLINLGQRIAPENEPALWLPSLREKTADREQMLESLARLYVSGASVDWAACHGTAARLASLALPTYPWERKSYWWTVENAPARAAEDEPVWERAAAAAARQAERAPLDLDVRAFPAKWEALNNLSAAYIANTLSALGAFSTPGQTHTPETLMEQFGILPAYRSLMARWLRTLAECGWLQADSDGSYRAARELERQPLDELVAEARATLADAPFVAEYLIECGEKLASVITGQESPLELMFPGGSMRRAEDLYQNWNHARYFNPIAGAAVEATCHARPNKPLRLLEIGAGTGATTAAVLPLLPAARVSYHFTDVSDLFLDRAREKFAAYPFVQYSLFDVEREARAQGYGQGQFDAVIAANVLHATRSLSETLRNVRGLLAPGGVLVLFEATTHLGWYDITTGLIEGWQSFADELRADSPLLAPGQWQEILRAEGFADVAVYPPPGSPAEILGESVIVARALPQGTAVSGQALALDDRPREETAADQPQADPGEAFLQQLREALPDERRERLLEFVRAHVMAVLRLERDAAPERKARLMDLGVDSLMAVELRGRLSLGLKLARKLPATLIFDYPTIEAITDFLLQNILVFESVEPVETAPASPAPQPTTSTDIETLSDAQVEEMLLSKLKKLK